MKGTEKQIKWAKDIQQKMIADLQKEIVALEAKLENKEMKPHRRKLEDYKKALQHIKNVTDAELLIKIRDFTAKNIRSFVFETQEAFEIRIWELG